MDYIKIIENRLRVKQIALETAKGRNQFDVCLKLEGQILALESVFIDLNQASQQDDSGNIKKTDIGYECPNCGFGYSTKKFAKDCCA